jgi:hypothetical protein
MANKPNNSSLNASNSIAKKVEQKRTPEHPSTTVSGNPSERPLHIAQDAMAPNHDLPTIPARESGGQAGLDPTRYGDWEKKGRCTDF